MRWRLLDFADSDLLATPLCFLYTGRDWSIYVRIDALDSLTKKRKQNPLPGDDASTNEAAPGRVGRDLQGEARRANATPNGGPHLELWRLRLKTWSKSDFSIAEATWPTYLWYIFLYSYICEYHRCMIYCRCLIHSHLSHLPVGLMDRSTRGPLDGSIAVLYSPVHSSSCYHVVSAYDVVAQLRSSFPLQAVEGVK